MCYECTWKWKYKKGSQKTNYGCQPNSCTKALKSVDEMSIFVSQCDWSFKIDLVCLTHHKMDIPHLSYGRVLF